MPGTGGTTGIEAVHGIMNVPAVGILFLLTLLLIRGTQQSALVNSLIVILKVSIVLMVIALGWGFIDPVNHTPFIPEATTYTNKDGLTHNYGGILGILGAAGVVFFAYIGFDAVSTAAQEAKNPKKDMPIGILGSLAVCTVLYILVSGILTGVVSYTQLSVPHPIAVGIAVTGKRWLEAAVEIGAIAGLSSVMLVMLLGQPRIFFSMAHDGLFPPVAARVHPRFGTPYVTTIITGLVCAVAGGTLPIEILGELTSIGTLFAFVLVSLGVMILRLRRPDIPRGFKAPGGPYLVPLGGVVSSGLLMYTATTHTIIRLFAWMLIGLVIYAAYGRKHSKLRAATTHPRSP